MEEKDQRPTPAILLIENDENDLFFFRRAMAKTGWPGNVRVVGTATEARTYMQNEYPFTDPIYYPTPRLIVSDYRLAGHTAMDFVLWLREQTQFAGIPLVLLSGATSGVPPEALAKINPTALIAKTPDVEKLCTTLRPFLPAA